ncbi:hypothetical protein HY995_02710 [Candidatus Micrarchaeota archaeon]|nr:hypothetical protein [Candidatus Micrarchaeota archaeon]
MPAKKIFGNGRLRRFAGMLPAAFALFPLNLSAGARGQTPTGLESRHDMAAQTLAETRKLPLHPTMRMNRRLVKSLVNLVVSDIKSLSGEALAEVWRLPNGTLRLIPTPNLTSQRHYRLLRQFAMGNQAAKEALLLTVADDRQSKNSPQIANGRESSVTAVHDLLEHLGSRSDIGEKPDFLKDFTLLYQRCVLDCRGFAGERKLSGVKVADVHVHDNGSAHSEADLKNSEIEPQEIISVSTKNGDAELLHAQNGRVWKLGRVGTAADHRRIVRAYKKFVGDPPKFSVEMAGNGNPVLSITGANPLRCLWENREGGWTRVALGGRKATHEMAQDGTAAVIIDARGTCTAIEFPVSPLGNAFRYESK